MKKTDSTGSRAGSWQISRWWPVLLFAVPVSASWADPPPTERADEPVRYAIIVTGGELLTGVYPDGHTYFLTRTLRPLGLACVCSLSIDDKPADIQAALRFAADKADLIIVTGGLGPTDNDITRETLSGFADIELAEHPEVVKQLERRLRKPRSEIRANLLRQTQVPVQGTSLNNPHGTAVGLVFDGRDTVIVALPGPPRELQPMVRDQLVPLLSRRFGTRMPGSCLTLRFVGLGQSQIDETMEQHVPLPGDITLTSQFEGGRVDFTFSLPDDNPQNETRLQVIKQGIMRHLGDFVYADDQTTLEDHVLQLLAARNARIAIAEVGSGGSLTVALSQASAARNAFAGAYVAASDSQLSELLRVSREDWDAAKTGRDRVQTLAAALADSTGSEWVVVIGELQRRDGVDWVDVVLKSPEGRVETHGLPLRMRGAEEIDHFRLTTQILDLLRRKLN